MKLLRDLLDKTADWSYSYIEKITKLNDKNELIILENPLILFLLVVTVALINYFIGFTIAILFISFLWFLNRTAFWVTLVLGFLFGSFNIHP